MDPRWVIENVSECNYVDYKREVTITRSEVDKNDFIMDVIAFANDPQADEKFIIYGVEVDNATKSRTIVGIDKSDFLDSASYQQLINENVEPMVNFDLSFAEIDGKWVGIIRIHDCDNPPYFAKRDRVNGTTKEKMIRAGDFWLRINDGKKKGGRQELDLITRAASKKREFDASKVKVMFPNGTDTIEIGTVGTFEKPSELAKKRIQSCQEKIQVRARLERDRYARKTGLPPGASIDSMFTMAHPIMPDPLAIQQYEDMGEEELQEALSKVQKDYEMDDLYELMVNRGVGFDFIITNDATEFIENVSIIVKFPSIDGIHLTTKEIEKPNHIRRELLSWVEIQRREKRRELTPKIIERNPLTIESSLERIRNGIEEHAFFIQPRVAFDSKLAGQEIPIDVSIIGKPLNHPIERRLTIRIKSET